MLTQKAVLQDLLRLSIATADASTLIELSVAMSEIAAPLVGADNAAFALLNRGGDALRVYQGPTPVAMETPLQLIRLDDPTPPAVVVRTRVPHIALSFDELKREFPGLAHGVDPLAATALATYPMIADDDLIGACYFRFANHAPVTDDHLLVMERIVPLVTRAASRIQGRAELERYAAQLAQSNADLDSFAAVVAHDLSGPVRRIGSFLQLLRREIEPLPPKATEYADTIASQVAHLSALLKDTLAYAHVVAPVDIRQPVDLDRLVADTLAPMRGDLDEVGATVEMDALPVLDVEASLIRQVFENLIDNSIKYRDDSRPLRIEIGAEPDRYLHDEHRTMWKLTFADNGIGIDPSRSAEVFAMFARLEVSDDRPGTGVGLAFVKRVVERHGGSVGIGKGIDGGTSIWFVLPGAVEHDDIGNGF